MDTMTAPTNRLHERDQIKSSLAQVLQELTDQHSTESILHYVDRRIGGLLRVVQAELVPSDDSNQPWHLHFGLNQLSDSARAAVTTSLEAVLGDMLTASQSTNKNQHVREKRNIKLVTSDKQHASAASVEITSDVASALAHKLRNYLAAIISAGEQLEETIAQPADADNEVLTALIARAAQAQRILIDRFLDAFGPIVVRNEYVNLHNCIYLTVCELRRQHGCDIIYDGESGQLCAVTDRTLLSRIVSEITANAIEASPTGNVSLRWHVKNSRLIIILKNDGVVPSDHKYGDFLQPFFTTKAGHTGLGLNIARRATEALGGTLRPISVHEQTMLAVSIPLQLEDLTNSHTERNC